jgi:hypothetical protein
MTDLSAAFAGSWDALASLKGLEHGLSTVRTRKEMAEALVMLATSVDRLEAAWLAHGVPPAVATLFGEARGLVGQALVEIRSAPKRSVRPNAALKAVVGRLESHVTALDAAAAAA